MSRRRKSSITNNSQEVQDYIWEAPARARRLAGVSTRKSLPTPLDSKSSHAATARLEESLDLLDDAVRLLEDQFRHRCRQRGQKFSEKLMRRFIQQWLSEPTQPESTDGYFRRRIKVRY